MKKVLPAFLVVCLISAGSVDAAVVLNEFVANGNPEWVEFYNSEDSTELLKTYWLDDDLIFDTDAGSSAKKQLTNLNSNNVHFPYVEITSMFNNSGDYVVLFDNLGNIVDQYQFDADPKSDVSLGRNPDSSGIWEKMNLTSKGEPNFITVIPTPIQNTPTVIPTAVPTPTNLPVLTPTPIEIIEPTPTNLPTPTPTTEPTPIIIEPTPTVVIPTSSVIPTPKPVPTEIPKYHFHKYWICENKQIKLWWGKKYKTITLPICNWQWKRWDFRFYPLHKLF